MSTFKNEIGHEITLAVTQPDAATVLIIMDGPTSRMENEITPIEARALRDALNDLMPPPSALDWWLATRSAPPYRTARHVAEEQWAAAWARHDSVKSAERPADANPAGDADREGGE